MLKYSSAPLGLLKILYPIPGAGAPGYKRFAPPGLFGFTGFWAMPPHAGCRIIAITTIRRITVQKPGNAEYSKKKPLHKNKKSPDSFSTARALLFSNGFS
jgi:hypothetical protein